MGLLCFTLTNMLKPKHFILNDPEKTNTQQEVSSNTVWMVKSSQSWLTASIDRGTNHGSVKLIAAANSATTPARLLLPFQAVMQPLRHFSLHVK